MAIITTGLGPNSAQIDYDAGETIDAVMNAIFSFITAHGWELHDADAGVTAKCYKARNYDNPLGDVESWKYVVIDWSDDSIKLKLYETWDATNHTGVNLAYRSDQIDFAQPINIATGGTMFCFANYRWLALLAYIGGVYGCSSGNGMTGVFEVERANSTDTWDATDPLPPVFWATAKGLGGGIVPYYIDGPVSFPRVKYPNGTGDSGAVYSIIQCLGFYLGHRTNGTNFAIYSENPWSGKNWVFNLTAGWGAPITGRPIEIRGRVFGLKALQRGLGANMDTAVVECNANYFWDKGGTATEHFIFAVDNGYKYILPK
jgi:hypothetical protein